MKRPIPITSRRVPFRNRVRRRRLRAARALASSALACALRTACLKPADAVGRACLKRTGVGSMSGPSLGTGSLPSGRGTLPGVVRPPCHFRQHSRLRSCVRLRLERRCARWRRRVFFWPRSDRLFFVGTSLAFQRGESGRPQAGEPVNVPFQNGISRCRAEQAVDADAAGRGSGHDVAGDEIALCRSAVQ